MVVCTLQNWGSDNRFQFVRLCLSVVCTLQNWGSDNNWNHGLMHDIVVCTLQNWGSDNPIWLYAPWFGRSSPFYTEKNGNIFSKITIVSSFF